jgi:hypothetical protein
LRALVKSHIAFYQRSQSVYYLGNLFIGAISFLINGF